jgi:predicted Zn-dependent protease
LILFSCATTGPGGKKSFILISESQEIALGQSVSEQVMGQEKALADDQWQTYLTEVGKKIAAVSDRSTLPFHFTVLDNDQINAFATPGGYLFFYTGILRMMETEDELAAVMAHEISHVVGRHSVKTIQTYYGGAIAANILLGDQAEKEIGQITEIVFGLALRGYGRSNEHEADEYGLHYMTKAGYNPQAMVTMFEKLAAASGDRESNFFEGLLSTHPDTKDRISRIKNQIAALPPENANRPLIKTKYSQMKSRLPVPAEKKEP